MSEQVVNNGAKLLDRDIEKKSFEKTRSAKQRKLNKKSLNTTVESDKQSVGRESSDSANIK